MNKSLVKLTLASCLIGVTLDGFAMSQKVANSDRGERRGPPPFCELDLDRDGVITFEEFKQHSIPHGEHEAIFEQIDTNGDGAISEQELKSHKPPKRRKM